MTPSPPGPAPPPGPPSSGAPADDPPGAVVDLLDLSHDRLAAWVRDVLGAPAALADRVFRAVHVDGARDVAALPGVGRAWRERLAGRVRFGGLILEDTRTDPDGTRKLLLRTADGHAIESVLLDLAGEGGPRAEGQGYTLCVSSQVGCNLGCRFCLTGTRRKVRDLGAGEIVDQVAHAARAVAGQARARSGERGKAVGNLVFMGMGEPLDNYDNVIRAIRTLQHPAGMDFSSRRVTISTAGVVPGIRRLAAETDPTVNLAVSLNATTDEARARIMPVGRAWPLADLVAALRDFPVPRRRRLTVEYVLLAGVNDTAADARRLATLLAGLPAKVNLLSFNPWDGAPFDRPEGAVVAAFRDDLRARGLTATHRASRGRGVGAACGQLGG